MNRDAALRVVDLDLCPFVGLRSFSEAERVYFCGREDEIHVIGANVNTSPLTILYGPSGVGKSSILQAGVVPYMRDERHRGVVYFSDWQRDDWFEALEGAVKRTTVVEPAEQQAVSASDVDWTAGPWNQDAGAEPAFVTLVREVGASLKGPLILIFDQFEDYLLRGGPTDGDSSFDACIATIVNRHDVEANILIGIREDYLSKIDRLRSRIPGLLSNTLRLDPLAPAQARAVVSLPIDLYNQAAALQNRPELAVEIPPDDDPIDTVVNEAWDGASYQLAALQIGMERLWTTETAQWKHDQRAGSRQLRRSVLGAGLGGVSGILRGYLESALSGLSAGSRTVVAAIFAQAVNRSGERLSFKRRDIGAGDDKRIDVVLSTLVVKKALRYTSPDRYEILHQVLAPAVLEWRRHYEARETIKREWQRTKYVVASVGCVVALVLAGTAAWNWWRAGENLGRANSVLFSLKARDALNDSARGPEVAVTLARHAFSLSDTQEARTALYQAVESWAASTVSTFCGHMQRATGVVYSPTGDIVSVGLDGTARIFSADGMPLREIAVPAADGLKGVNAVAYAPDGTLITAGDDGFVRGWNTAQPSKPIWQIDAREDGKEEIWTLAVSPDGARLATGGEKGIVKLWDLRDDLHKQLGSYRHDRSVVNVAFDSNGARVASGGMDKVVRVWDVARRRLVTTLDGPLDFVYGVAFAPGADSNEVAASGWDGLVWLWDLKDPSQARRVLTTQSPNLWGVAYSLDGRLLAAAGRDGRVTLWDRRALDKETAVLASGAPGLTTLTFNRASTQLVAASMSGDLKVWALPSVHLSLQSNNRSANNATFSPDGRRVLAYGNGPPAVFDARTGVTLSSATTGENQSLLSAAFSSDSATFAVGGLVPKVFVRNGDRVTTLTGPTDAISGVAFDSTGQRVAASSWDKSAWVWDLSSGKGTPIVGAGASLSFDVARATAVAFSPDRDLLAIGGNSRSQEIFVRELSSTRTWKLRVPKDDGVGDVSRLAFGKKQYLVAGFSSGLLAAWQLPDEPTNESLSPNLLSPGHKTRVTDLQFDQDGTLASSSGDGTTKVWDLPTRSVRFAMSGHLGGVYALSFNSRSSQLTTVGEDGVLLPHLLQWNEVRNRASQLGRRLTPVECFDYFGERNCEALLAFTPPTPTSCSAR